MTEIALGVLVIVALVVGLAAGLLGARRRLIPAEAIHVRVNESLVLPAHRGDKLLDVLHNADIQIPAACGGKGTCGLCRVSVSGAGAGEPQAAERGMLSPRERRAGVRLACQTALRGSCDVALSEEALGAGGGYICTVASVRMLAPLIREIVLDLPGDRPSRFRAGDFIQVTAPPFRLDFRSLEVPPEYQEAWDIAEWRNLNVSSETEVTRAYSLASRPEDEGKAVLNIRLAVPPAGREDIVPPGIVSSWLFSLRPGDAVKVSGPFGDFHVQPSDREMVYIGGGVGMAPLRAMIHQELGQGTSRRIRYFYGARSAADLFYSDEFEDLAKKYENFTWTPALSDPAPGDRWRGKVGFVHEILRGEMSAHPAPEDCEYYLCGPPVMISVVLSTLRQLGVESHSIFYDDFGS